MSKREIFIIFILLAIAFVRFLFFLPARPPYEKAIGREVELTGVVIDSPDERVYNKRLTVRPDGQESSILVVVPREENVSYGDKILVSGTLETPENFITNTGKEFNYERYLANQNIYFIINDASVKIISQNNGSFIKSILFKVKDVFMKNLKRVIISPENDLASGLILGARGGFDNDMRQEFIITGTIHIVALSGYNITIVAENVMKIFGLFLSQTLSAIFGIFIIILFILMTGASSTAVRAGIMAVIVLFARITGRSYDAGRALVVALLLMVAYDLRVLTDMSFQLSFLATFGILFITPKLLLVLKFLPIRFKIRETVATTLSATIAVLPAILHSTGVLSIVSLPANVIILPIIPFAMFFSFMTGIIGVVSYTLSVPFAFISEALLSFILWVIHFFASFPFASLTIKSFPLVLIIILYSLIAWWVFRR